MKLYAYVGLRTPGEEIEANFGQKAFLFDIDVYKQVCVREMERVRGEREWIYREREREEKRREESERD